jgi:hypothetical protein
MTILPAFMSAMASSIGLTGRDRFGGGRKVVNILLNV